MLDGVDGDAGVAEAGRVIEAGEVLDLRRDARADVVAIEADAVLGGGGAQFQSNRLTGMKADSGTSHGPLQRPSISHAVVSRLLTDVPLGRGLSKGHAFLCQL